MTACHDEGADRLGCRDPDALEKRRPVSQPPSKTFYLMPARSCEEDGLLLRLHKHGSRETHLLENWKVGVVEKPRFAEIGQEREVQIRGHHRPVARTLEAEREEFLPESGAMEKRLSRCERDKRVTTP